MAGTMFEAKAKSLVPRQTNSALLALQMIAGIGLLFGLVLVIVGNAMNEDAYGGSLPGLAAMVWGGVFLNVSALSFFGALTAAAVRWKPKR